MGLDRSGGGAWQLLLLLCGLAYLAGLGVSVLVFCVFMGLGWVRKFDNGVVLGPASLGCGYGVMVCGDVDVVSFVSFVS